MFNIKSKFNQFKCPYVKDGVNNCNRSYCQFNHDLNFIDVNNVLNIESYILKYFPNDNNSVQPADSIDHPKATTSKPITLPGNGFV